jgi:hypothetical protein
MSIGSIADLVSVVRLDDGDWKVTYKQNGKTLIVEGYMEDQVSTEHENGQLSNISLSFIPNEN